MMKYEIMKRKLITIIIMMTALPLFSQSHQPQVIDKVVAVVGKNIILQSDIENQYIQYRLQGMTDGTAKEVRGRILEDLLLQKLMLNQAEMDSISVTDEDVETQMDQRIRLFINKFGSQEKMEAQFGKTMSEIKEEVRQAIKDQMLQEQVQSKIMQNVVVTPQEVKNFFHDIPKDSLPTISPDYEIVQIVKRPPVSIDEKLQVKDRLYQIRKRILEGESSFATMAVLYSEDPGSARNGGELGFAGKGVYATAFENAAFALHDGEISDVIETEFGFHIIQLIERRGETINCRHILLTAKVPVEALEKAQHELDSVAQLIHNGDMSFEDACKKFSDEDSRNNGGYLTNAGTGGNWLSIRDLQELENNYPEYKNLAFVISRLDVGELSDPIPMTTNDNKDAFRLIMIKQKTETHQANLKDDYNLIQNWALGQKRQEAIEKWVSDKAAKAYIRLDEAFKNYDYYYDWNFQ